MNRLPGALFQSLSASGGHVPFRIAYCSMASVKDSRSTRWTDASIAKHRRLAGQGVYVLYRKVYSGLLGYGEQVQYRVGRAPHGNIESHRIEECRASSDVTGQYAFIAVLVISPAVLHDLSGSLYE